MIDAAKARQVLAYHQLSPWDEQIEAQLAERLGVNRHGDWARWQSALDAMPPLDIDAVTCTDGAVTLNTATALDVATAERLRRQLMELHPWRKGPFRIGELHIDTEWRSDWKWSRVLPHIAPLTDRLVLDVGCGNGYYCWRIAMQGAKQVIGIDPTAVFLAQFLAIRHYARRGDPVLAERVMLLPLGIEHMPPKLQRFDTVLSMGILYHRRSPLDHLMELRDALRPGGQLILETLIVDGNVDTVLIPPSRYAKMRNVWFIPSIAMLERWVERCGFSEVKTVDVTPTTPGEQRSTSWMTFESLADFLHPADTRLTIEGHPAPVRAVLVAEA